MIPRPKIWRLTASSIFWKVVVAGSFVWTEAGVTKPQTTVLNVARSLTLPLKEVSGLSFWNGSVFAVGDRTHQIFEVPLSDTGGAILESIKSIDFRKNIPGVAASSQWEAIQMDPSGVAFVLSESPPELIVLKPKTTEHIRSIPLKVPTMNPFRQAWNSDPSSGGEGLLLFEDGLILIAKEKNPPALLLFGPAKSKLPSTVQPLRSKSWSVPKDQELELLWSWQPKPIGDFPLSDFSELALSPQGEIVILSDESRQFCVVLNPLSVAEKHFDTKACFEFGGRVKNPEGLTYQGSKAIIGIDNSAKKPNIFFLTSPPNNTTKTSP